MNGFYFGMVSVWNNTIAPWLATRRAISAGLKGPIEKDFQTLIPAGEAMMSGFQQGLESGWHDTAGFLSSIAPSIGGMNGAGGTTFGPGAVQVTFAGVVPTEAEAYRTGLAVGRGIDDVLGEQRIKTMARMS
jgi:hypothetical protein